MTNNVLAIIPARANSKGVPGKNKMKLNGVSLVGHAYSIASKSKFVTDIVISTDDEEIIEKFLHKDDVLVHRRISKLASDESPISDTICSVISDLDKKFDFILLLQPTSPNRSATDIDICINKIIKSSHINSIVSVCKMDDIHPGRMYWISEDGSIESVLKKYETTRRQDNKPVYYRNGAIYLVRAKFFNDKKNMIISPIYPYIMDSEYLLNIDSKRDKLIAETIHNYWIENNNL